MSLVTGQLVARHLVGTKIVAAFEFPPFRAVLAVTDRQQTTSAEVLGWQLVDVEYRTTPHTQLRLTCYPQIDDVHNPTAVHGRDLTAASSL